MSKNILTSIAEGLIATILVFVLYLTNVITGWGLVAFLFMLILVFTLGRKMYEYWSR